MTEPEEPRATLYDFLHFDHERVKSLYARLFSGLPGAIESVASDAKTKTNTLKVGGDPLGRAERQSSKQVLESRLERIDPRDLIPRDALEGLKEHNLIHTAPEEATPGRVVPLHGMVGILDFTAYKHFFDLMPRFMRMLGEEPPPAASSRKKGRKRPRKGEH
jgi:hypothetical protein